MKYLVLASLTLTGLFAALPPPLARAEVRAYFPERVLFPTGSARLRREFVPVVEAVARRIRTGPAGRRILLEGHTDASPAELQKASLSQKRSEAIRDMLVRMGVDKAILLTRAFAARWPAATNRTEEGREQNRRVEFLIAPDDFGSTATSVGAGPAEVPPHIATLRAAGTTVTTKDGRRTRLQAEDAVHAGERVETANDGRATLRLPGVALARLGPASELRVRRLAAAEADGVGGSALTLERGAMSLRFHYPVSLDGARVLLLTPHGNLSAEHPAHLRLQRRDDEVRVEVLAGKASWRSEDAQLELRPGDAMRTTGKGTTQVAKLPLPPRPQSPLEGKVQKALLWWSAVDGASGYLLEVARDIEFLDVQARRLVGVTSDEVELPDGVWYWRVRSRDAHDHSSRPSPIHSFELAR